MKKLLLSLSVLGFLMVGVSSAQASVLGDLINQINSLRSKMTATVVDSTGRTIQGTPALNPEIPRIMYWGGMVNQHIDPADGMWDTDPDGTSGAGEDKLTYCRKWYPDTNSVQDYQNETISTWRAAGNTGEYASTKMSTKCVSTKSGTIVNLPTVTTTPVSSITSTGATSGGNVTSDGGASVTAKGIVWSTFPNPTIALNTLTVYGTGIGSFPATATSLSPNTTYYIRAFATNSVGTAYGNEVSFKTSNSSVLSLPTVTSSPVTNITSTGATSGGNVTADGGATVTERGVVFGTSTDPTINLITKTSTGGGMGTFSVPIYYLTPNTPNTTYYLRAYATNSVGTAYGVNIKFTSPPAVILTPAVVTLPPINISETNIGMHGKVTSEGGSPVTSKGFIISTTKQQPKYSDINGTDTEAYSETSGLGEYWIGVAAYDPIKNPRGSLKPDTYYYIVAYARNSAGVAYGDTWTVKTISGVPTDDLSPRIMLWPGKVYQYVNLTTKRWEPSVNSSAGTMTDKLAICKIHYPKTIGVENYRYEENINWREPPNVGQYTTTVISTSCIQPDISSPTTDPTPRIMYWTGKVNQHVNVAAKQWESDPDRVSGTNIDKLTYCLKWYPKTVSIRDYKYETINTWRLEKGWGEGYFTGTNMSTECVQPTVPVQTYGTITASPDPCYIQKDQSSCSTTLSWTTTNPITTSTVIDANGTIINTGNSGSKVASLSPNGESYFLMNNSINLDEVSPVAKCVTGTSWNGTKCASTVTPLPDLIVSDFSWTPVNPVVTVPNGYIDISVTINNIGQANAVLPQYMQINLYKNNSLTTDTSSGLLAGGISIGPVGSSYYPSITLNSGSSKTYNFRTAEDPNILENAGTFYLLVKVDGSLLTTEVNGLVAESNENNNTLTKKITITSSTNGILPIVKTNPATTVGSTYATLNGNVSLPNGATEINTKGFIFDTSSNNLVIGSANSFIVSGGVGDFSKYATSLTPNTSYYVRAYATNSSGVAYGEITSFRTLSTNNGVTPTVMTYDPTNITQTGATLKGYVTLGTGATSVTERGFIYNTILPLPNISDTKVYSYASTGSFSVNLGYLLPNTTYYVRAYAVNSAGIAYGPTITFKTLSTTGSAGIPSASSCLNGETYNATTGQLCPKPQCSDGKNNDGDTTIDQNDINCHFAMRLTGAYMSNFNSESATDLFLARTLNTGSVGDDVKALQKYLGITVDGSYGPNTVTAVKAWQTKNGLTSDGIFGPSCYNRMYLELFNLSQM